MSNPHGGKGQCSCMDPQHVGIRRYGQFLRQVYDLLDDDGVFFLQVAGIRSVWQYEDLIWGLFMNKYVFPGADASCALNWVINQVRPIFVQTCPITDPTSARKQRL